MTSIPKRLESMIEQYCEMGRAIDKLLREHTNNAVCICSPDHVQFWIDEDNIYENERGCTIEDFKQLVGPRKVKFRHESDEGYHHFDVTIGTEVCTLVTYKSDAGGASDDVSTNTQA